MCRGIQTIIDKIRLPVVEVAGPSPSGYRVLKNLGLSIPKPTITNTTKEVTVYSPDDSPHTHAVDEIVDIRDMPYIDNSIGILMCSYLPPTDYPSEQNPARTAKEIEDEYQEIIKGNKDPRESPNLHISLLAAATRVLDAGGILILQGVHPEDTNVARKLELMPLLAASDEKLIDSQIYLK